MAAPDFHDISQREKETVAEFIKCLRHSFQLACGQDGIQPEMRNTLLHGQFEEGLKQNLIEATEVSGAMSHK